MDEETPSGVFTFPSQVCSIYGIDHVTTFAQHRFRLPRVCQYILAKFGDTEEVCCDQCQFPKKSCQKSCHIKFYGGHCMQRATLGNEKLANVQAFL